MLITVTGIFPLLDTWMTVIVIVIVIVLFSSREVYWLVDVAIMMTLAEVEDEVISTAAEEVGEDEEGGG